MRFEASGLPRLVNVETRAGNSTNYQFASQRTADNRRGFVSIGWLGISRLYFSAFDVRIKLSGCIFSYARRLG
jgi:hypothetical protein